VNIGRAFLESRHMLIAFETYCINQAAAVYLVDQLTQDRELLRIFLEELPKDRISLRKMDLKSFLMIPVQRVTK
jgi:RhoGEF domain